MQVLLIDDHPIVLEGTKQLLKYAGVKRIVETQSLAEGFKKCYTAARVAGPRG